ncbi:MAG: hypothetical protein ABI592_01615 [Acidobacteriota bacterium]
MTLRRAPAGLLAAAAVFPCLDWLFPALFRRAAPTFRDQADFFFPLKLYTADRLRAGELPLWNPLSGCGEPWLANLQSGAFYPPGLLFLLPSAALAAGLFLVLHFAAAVAGTRAFLRQEGATEAASLAGAASFAASGFAASLCGYWNHFGAYAWLPILAALARGGLATRASRLAFAGLFAVQALSGSPEISGATAAIALLFVWRALPAREGGFQPSPRLRLGRLAASAALGLVLAAVALVPFGELTLRSERRGPLPAVERDAGAVGWQGLAGVTGLSRGSGTSYLPSLAAGTLTLVLAAAALRERERRPLTLVLAGIVLAGVALAAAGPPGAWLRSLPPLDRIRYPAKALAPAAFALAVLAGLGLDSLRFSREARHRIFLAGAATAGALLIAFSAQPAVARAAEAAGLAALAAVALVSPERLPWQGAMQTAAALFLCAGLAFSGGRLFRFAPESELRRIPPAVSVLAALPGRVLTPPMATLVPAVLRDDAFDAATLRRQREALLGYTNLTMGVRTLRTASPLATLSARAVADVVDSERDPQRPAGAASGRVLWTPYLPPNMGSRRVGDYFRAPIHPYRPRLSFVRAFSIEPDPAKAWARMARGDADWERTVFVDREPSPRPVEGSARKGFLIARIAEDRPERVVAEVHADGAGLLVLTDLAWPGWRAEVDGKRAEILLADGCFRAVALAAGPHRVAFLYRPVSFAAGAALSAAGLILLVVLVRRGEPARAGAVL